MQQQQPGVSELWIQHQRRNNKTTSSWACIFCSDRQIFTSADELWKHAQLSHHDRLPATDEDGSGLEDFRKTFEANSAQKKPNKEDFQPRRTHAAATSQESSPQTKRPLSSPAPFLPPRSLSGLQALNLGGTPRDGEDVSMQDVSEDNQAISDQQPRKRAAVGDGISAGSASPFRESSTSPPPRRSKARPTSASYTTLSETENSRPHVPKKQLWSPEHDSPLTRASIDPSNVASTHTQKTRASGLQAKSKRSQPPSQLMSRPATAGQILDPSIVGMCVGNKASSSSLNLTQKEEQYDIILQPETRPISQEQLVAEVKGIYAGLVMVEAKCIEVDTKQSALAAANAGAQGKLNNEQWQALIALHRTLLHEHHDFFLASQHPSASPALRRLASKYAMPARMWRHGIHSFLELLRHRLPASLDHMLAFIYLAYSMMALLYETVPAFEDTWIECLGDLGRYRMAIEDDDIRDREVWTGVARHWYSKASDKAPTTGRLYHHLAILARPNALLQLFYYSKSLCVAVPFVSARESILTLFEPVLNAENGQASNRLPPLDTAFVKAHGRLFTNRDIDKFDVAKEEFLGLLDQQIGRVTKKFMEQGYQIAVSNCVALLGSAAKENLLMQAITPKLDTDVQVEETAEQKSMSMTLFKHAQGLANSTLLIVLQRIGDPNILPFLHVTLAFMYGMSKHAAAMTILETDFPWESLAVVLNTLLASQTDITRIENEQFPLPEKDVVQPFPEDFAVRGLLWTEKYFPEKWFVSEEFDEEEKRHERPSMFEQRKERILWLACRIASTWSYLTYDSTTPLFTAKAGEIDTLSSRTSTFASATTIGRSDTWTSADQDAETLSDTEDLA